MKLSTAQIFERRQRMPLNQPLAPVVLDALSPDRTSGISTGEVQWHKVALSDDSKQQSNYLQLLTSGGQYL